LEAVFTTVKIHNLSIDLIRQAVLDFNMNTVYKCDYCGLSDYIAKSSKYAITNLRTCDNQSWVWGICYIFTFI